MGGKWPPPPADWVGAVNSKKQENIAKMAPRLMKNSSPMDYYGALGALRTIIKERPDTILVNEGDSAFGFCGMEVETICRYQLPVCIVVFNNNGIYRGTDVNPTGGSDAATTVFVKDARYDKIAVAFGGVGAHVTTPDELSRAVNKAMDSGKPTLINAVIDPAAGTESGRIGNLNPQSVVRKK